MKEWMFPCAESNDAVCVCDHTSLSSQLVMKATVARYAFVTLP